MTASPVSPKVTAGAAVAAIVGLLLQVSVSITPDTFSWLGAGQGLAFTLVTLGIGTFAAWWKTDPLRVVPAPEAPAAPAVTSTLTGTGPLGSNATSYKQASDALSAAISDSAPAVATASGLIVVTPTNPEPLAP